MGFFWNFPEVSPGRTAIDAEQPRNFAQPLAVFGRQFAPRAQHFGDQAVGLFPSLRISRKHRWNCGERGFFIDQQDRKLLAYERLEFRYRQATVRLANSASQFKSPLVDRRSPHPCVNKPADDRLTDPANRNARFEFGNFLVQ